jgi:hypothetical protein
MAQQQMSLFGPSLAQTQAAMAQEDEATTARLAQLSPEQQLTRVALQGGRQAGRALGGLFGIEDPRLKEAAQQEAIFKELKDSGVDFTKPEQLYPALINAYQSRGMIDKAIVASAKYEDVKSASLKTEAELGLKGAQTEKALAEAAKAQREKLDTPFGKVDPDKFTPESLDKFRETGNYADLVAKPDKAKAPPSVGQDREAIAQDMYGTDFYSLTQEQKRAVNKKADERAERLKPSLSVTLPKNLKSIGDVREQFTTSVKPYITAANAAEQSEAMIDQASKGNFQGWRAAITQLAKSVGDSQISRAEIEAYGIDPSLVGSIVDRTSIFLSGTPSQDTINSAKKIASLVKKVNQDRAKQEQGTFLELATQAEGYNPKTTPRFFELPFAPTKQEVQEGTTSSGTKYKLTIK